MSARGAGAGRGWGQRGIARRPRGNACSPAHLHVPRAAPKCVGRAAHLGGRLPAKRFCLGHQVVQQLQHVQQARALPLHGDQRHERAHEPLARGGRHAAGAARVC
eukprot:1426959-Prymnesium_polylepis.1